MSSPKFSRRHYVAVAEVLSESFDMFSKDRRQTPAVLYALTDKMAYMFQDDNPRFDFARFWEAVRGEE